MSPFNINFKNKNAFVSAADRPAFIAEVKKKYEEEEAAKAAANPTGGSRSKLLDSLEESTVQARLRKRDREAKRTQAYNTMLKSLKERDDFDELANKGAGKASRVNFGNNRFGNTMMGQTVGTPEVREQYANYLQENTISQNPFAYMTDEQKNIYNAFIGLGDRRSAQRYLASIEAELQQQAATKAMENMPDVNYQTKKEFEAQQGTAKEYNRWEELGKAINLAQISAQSQAQSAITGMKQIGQDEAVAPNYTELMYEQLRPTLSGTAGVISDVAGSVGFMLPAVAVSALTGGAGQVISAGLFAAASGGRTYNQMLREDPTVDKFSAKTYSIINGALEGTLQYALGGIGKLGGKIGLTKLVGKAGLNAALAKKLLNVAQASANTPAVQRLVRTLTAAGQYGSGMADEAIEEWLQAVIDPAVRNVIFDENNKIQPFSEDKLYAAMLGALGAAVMNAPNTVSNYKNADVTLNKAIIRNAIKDAKAKGNTSAANVPELTEEQLAAYGNDPDVAELATEIARLEEALPNRKKADRAKAQKHINDLKKRLANLVEKKAKNQEVAPEESNVPLPPPAPTADQGLGLINMALGEDVDNMGNYARTQPGEEGRNLIGAGVRNGTEGIITPSVENARPAGERINNTQTRGIRPGDIRRQNVQDRLAQRQQETAQEPALSPEESMVEDYFGQTITDTLKDYQSGEIDAELAQGWVSGMVERFRNYAQNVLGWTEEQIEAQIASWNAPAELMEKPQPKFPKPENKWRQTQAKPVQQEATAETNKVTKEDLERQLAEKEEQVRQLEEQARANAEEIKRRTEEAQQPAETAAEENEEYTAEELVEKFRADMKEAQTLYRSQMDRAEYGRYVNNLTDLFRSDAEKAGMSLADIEAEIASLGNNTQQNTVTDEDIDEALGTKEETQQPTESKDELRDVFDALDNDEITTGQAYDEVTAMLNQEDAQRTAGEEAQLGEYNNKPQVTVTDGRIEVKFPKYADKETRQQLKEAGFQWDRTAKVWWGGENNANRALVEELTGVKLTEDEFKPGVRRIPKEGLDNDGGRRSEVLGDTAKRNVYPDVRSRVQRVLEEYERTEVSGKYPGDTAPKTGIVKDVEESGKRVYEISQANLPDVAVPEIQRYLSSDVKIKIVDDTFLDNVDSSSPEWQKVLQIRQDFRDGKYAPGYKPVFFIPSTASTVSPASGYNDIYFEAITYPGTRKVFFRLDGISDITQNADHERFHTWVNEYPKLRYYVLAKLQQAGMEQKQLEGLVGLVAGNRWRYLKDNNIFDSYQYYAYAEEILAELFSRSKWGIDLTSVPEDERDYYPLYALGFNIVDNSKDAYYILGERAKWEDVVNDAVFEFFELTNNGKEQDISKTIRKAQDSGFFTPSKINFDIIDQMAKNSKDGMKSVYDAWDTHSFVDKRTEKKNPAAFDIIDHILDNIDQLAGDPNNHFSQEDISALRSATKSVRSMFQDARGLREIFPDYENSNEHDIRSTLRNIEAALDPNIKNNNLDINDIIRRLYGMEDVFGPAVRYNSLGVTVPSSTFSPNKSGEVPVENMIPGVKEIWENLPDSVKKYMSKPLSDINAEAWKNIMKKGGVDAVSGTLLKAKNWNAPQLEMAVEVGKYLADNGETDRAADIFTKVAAQQTDFGRAIKYLQTLQMYMPKVASAITHSIANDLGVELTNEELENIKLCDRIIEQGFISNSVMNKATGDFKEWLNDARDYVDRGLLDPSTAAYAAAMTLVTDKVPSTARQKFRSLQRISLLSNPKTHFRNILGNVAEQAGAAMSRPGADVVDRFLSKFTHQRTFGSGGGEAFAKAVATSIEQAVMDHALGINTVGNKFDEDTTNRKGLEQLVQQKVWDENTQSSVRNGIAKVANNIDELIGLGLSIGDAPFLIGTYESALAQIMNANQDELVNGEPTAEMMDTAWDVAYRRTFRDSNAVTKALTSMRNSLPFIGETIAPYVQTPANVVLTAIQYSPIGLGEAVAKAFFDIGGAESLRTKLKNKESTMKVQRQIAELVGRGALGTACMLIGAMLAAAGRITGDDDDLDSTKEKNWNRAVGRMGSSIKIGDTYIDPSSLQSLSTPIMAGAASYWSDQEEDETGKAVDILAAAVKASMKMGNTMLEMPVLQGVADLFSGNYDNGELLAGALSLAGNAATQIVPFGSLAKQGAKAVDPYSRVQSEINAGPVERVTKSVANNLRSMTPWTRKKLSERYDVLGNPIKNDVSDNTVERLYNSFINPFNTSKEKADEVTEEIDRLYASLKDTDILPSAAGNSVSYGGEQYKFTSAEKQEYQRVEGESNAEILSSLVNSDAYDKLSDEEKAKVIESVYKYSADKAKAAYLESKGVDYEPDDTWMGKIDTVVADGVDIGSALVYRYEINQIDNADDQAYYIMDLPLTADQKKSMDTQFVDKFGFRPIEDDRDYTSKDTLVLSMTSDKGRDKFSRIFSGQWTGSSGNTYPAMTGEQFGDFYDAFYFKESPKAAESTESIKQMLMQKYGMDESSAYTMAYDFRKLFASTKK